MVVPRVSSAAGEYSGGSSTTETAPWATDPMMNSRPRRGLSNRASTNVATTVSAAVNAPGALLRLTVVPTMVDVLEVAWIPVPWMNAR